MIAASASRRQRSARRCRTRRLRAAPDRASRSAFLGCSCLLPLVAVFVAGASRTASRAYCAAITEPDALAAIRLTLLVAAIAVPLNVVFGIAAAWAIARFEFPGQERC